MGNVLKRAAICLAIVAATVSLSGQSKGLLTVAAGDNVVRVLPPLNIEESHIREFVDRLSAAAAEYEVPAEAA